MIKSCCGCSHAKTCKRSVYGVRCKKHDGVEDKIMHIFGKTSLVRLKTCRPEVRSIMMEAIVTSDIDFGIVCGGRNEGAQNKAVSDGFSNAKWGESDHNIMKGDKMYSPAVDVAPYSAVIKNYIWNDRALWNYLHAHIESTAKRLGYQMMCGLTLKNGIADNPHCLLVY